MGRAELWMRVLLRTTGWRRLHVVYCDFYTNVAYVYIRAVRRRRRQTAFQRFSYNYYFISCYDFFMHFFLAFP